MSIAAIEASARAALPALVEVATRGWVLRANGGATKRVNSANPTTPGARLDDVLARAESFYTERHQPPRFRLTPLASPGVDEALAARGYARVDDSWTMVTPLADRTVGPAVRFVAVASPEWLAGYAATVGWSPVQTAAHASVLGRMPAAAVATLDDGERPIAWGIAAIADGRACLFDVAVAADRRGRGVGRRLVESLLGWAAMQDCGEALLQVAAVNAPARRLYASLGFVDAYPYHYRVAPSRD